MKKFVNDPAAFVPELGDEPHVNITLADLCELAAEHAPA